MMTALPTEMAVLVSLTLLTASLWIPYIIGVNTAPAGSLPKDPSDFTRPLDPAHHRPWVHRAYRAHLNLLEQFLPFAVLVLVLHLVDGFTTLTYWTAIAFFWLRVAHAVGMITGLAGFPTRPIIFTAGWICTLMMGWVAFTT